MKLKLTGKEEENTDGERKESKLKEQQLCVISCL